MAKNWLSITVELLGGRGQDLWPWPGRIFAVGPSHTFEDLAHAINDGFARWDRAHLSVFTLMDGQVLTDEKTGNELAGAMAGPLLRPLDFARTKVAETVRPGDEFQFEFDLGDGWMHRCTVGSEKVDPLKTLGIQPKTPLPYWGWGTIPDQYGRRWEDDDGQGRTPRRPREPHTMLTGQWPNHRQLPQLEAEELRSAAASCDAEAFLAAVSGRLIDDALQQVGQGMLMAIEQKPDDAADATFSVINRLIFRGFPGDQELADLLLARLRGVPLEGEALPVDLELLSSLLEGDPGLSSGAYVDRHTGEVYPGSLTDPAMVGEDATIDTDQDPSRWLWLEHIDSRKAWEDMAAFARQQVHNLELKERMESAIEGRGAFRAFRALLREEGLSEAWELFSADRRIGRARQLLAAEGITVTHPA
ncbi:UPF0158 family protein [Nesterenkonia alkaliphila]|uniref:Uncharacterized protein n=1 Tax=Nesterenkonia alkaliphila TaxID=1463631 RepID=A0A7K1UF10_9MICC|nr:UPF0158 family protein [Nesterenkonia alkaliphila]MVT24956.1 hypothetical protein [Nesterenkonia alkaliphila]GFZ86928.1 hypothetical protein GCM10011359_15080 [Nesterenkonia alkaliphila]